jgi:hypothetical protein
MGVVTKQEYDEKLSVISPRDTPAHSPFNSNPASGASSPKRKAKKADAKVNKLNELLSMGIITQEEYNERLSKIKAESG